MWSNGLCSIFYPPRYGKVTVETVTKWARNVALEGTTREGGIQLCAPCWGRYYHIGDIPTRTEIQSLYDPRRPSFTTIDLEFRATDDDDPEYEGNVPCTMEAAPTTPALVDVVLVRQWLMDSGSAMDLIDENAAEPFAHFIEEGEEVRLATANGVIGSKRLKFT